MKTYVLTLSQVFPKNHSRKGESTGFATNKKKIHTIRGSYALWKKRFETIDKGQGMLAIRQWSGKPYVSPQIEVANLYREDGIGIQKIEFDPAVHSCKIDGKEHLVEESVAVNDGLSYKDFKEWFKGDDDFEPMVVIHFTKFRY
jgi:hypothetical protein